MSLQSDDDQLTELRRYARLLVERTGEQEDQLEALVASAERDVHQGEAALSQSTGADVNHVRKLLSTQVQRSAEGAASARRICVSAHQQHAAARQLLTHLDGDGRGDGERPHAVLVVDDYGDIREVLACVLQDAGFVVRTAANGLEALIAAYEMRPGVIVMDVSMPVMDGIEATRLIKATKATRGARVIAYTGNPSLYYDAAEALFAAVLLKPATPETLIATVQQVAGL